MKQRLLIIAVFGLSFLAAKAQVTIGDNTSNSSYVVPYVNNYKYSTAQMLYTPSEIGGSGKITSISFKVARKFSLSTSELKIYLGHKSGTFSSASNYVSSSNLTLVYSGTPTLGQSTGWEKIQFNQGEFTYNGTDNLVVVVTRKSSNYNATLTYYYFTGSGYTLYRRSDNYVNYGDVSNTSYSYTTSNNRPSIKIEMQTSQTTTSSFTVGDNATNISAVLPYFNSYKYSTTQMLYTPSEIGGSGKITSISFKVASKSSLSTSELKIYLGHKSGTFSSASNYVSRSNLRLVYSGTPTLGQSTGWEKIQFNQGEFTYNGTDNLVVVVTRKSANYNDNLKYYYFTGSGYTLYRRSDVYANYGDVSDTSYSYTTSNYRASIKIEMQESVPSGVVIGDNATSSGFSVPYCNYNKYSTTQMLYTPSEIGGSGKITGISFKVANASSLATSEVKVYLGHKSSKFSGTNDYVTSNNLTLVYSGSPTIGHSTGWERMQFNQGEFTYNGTDNLVVVVTKKSTDYKSTLKYYYFTGSGYTLCRGSDSNSDYGDVSKIISYSTSNNRPSVKIEIAGIIGDNATESGDVVPYVNSWKYSTAQMLYTPKEIGAKGKINSISFKVASASSISTSEVKVYLGHKAGTFSSSSNYVGIGSLTLVYSGTPTIGQSTGWEKLVFNQTDFTYNGTDNLVVVVTKKCENYKTDLKYYYFTGSGYTLYRQSYSDFECAEVSSTSYTYITSSGRPSIRIGFGSYQPPTHLTQDTDFTTGGVTYTLHPNASATIKTVTASWQEIEIPRTVSYDGDTFSVNEIGASAFSAYTNYAITLPSTITAIHANAFVDSKALSIVYNGSTHIKEAHITAMKTKTPNVLLFVNSTNQLYYTSLQNTANVVVWSTAKTVELKDGHNFHCPKQFTASNISYKRNFQMTSGINGNSAGWETIALPFNVESIRHSTKGELTPFYNYTKNSNYKPFWLYSWSSTGWKKAGTISHNTPYLICFPNNEIYQADYNLAGEITFSSSDVYVYKSSTNRTDYTSSYYDSRYFYPTFVALTKGDKIYNINSGSTASETGNVTPGSAFIKNLRNAKPFEGYIYSTSVAATMYMIRPFVDDETTDIMNVNLDNVESGHLRETSVYDLKGKLILRTKDVNTENALDQLPKGIYIVNGKKVLIK